MEFCLTNGTDCLSINPISKVTDENWFSSLVKINIKSIMYQYGAGFQLQDFAGFLLSINKLLNGSIEAAEFICLEEWLYLKIVKMDHLGHYQIQIKIQNGDTQIMTLFQIDQINFEHLPQSLEIFCRDIAGNTGSSICRII